VAVVPNSLPTGAVAITGIVTQGQTLTANNTLADVDGMGLVSYQWQADGANVAGASSATLTLTQAQVGKAITVKASYTDNLGAAESVTSSATSAVLNVNDLPTGAVTISGTAAQGQALTAANTLADIDGIPTTGANAIAYQWQAGGTDIAGATSANLTLTQAQVGKAITVKVSYTDNLGTPESRTSSATTAVLNVNDSPVGKPIVSGTPTQGQSLMVVTSGISDLDGVGPIALQWQADGTDIAGATSATLTLTQAQVGKAITVKASYTDNLGAAESVTSSATSAVLNVNDLPTGAVAIKGSGLVGLSLTAINTLADIDGMGTVAYQWLIDGADIANATGDTYKLRTTDADKMITVKASYTDGYGTKESVTLATGIKPALEKGDGNGDGIADSEQQNVVSLAMTKLGNLDKVSVTLATAINNSTINSNTPEFINLQQIGTPSSLPPALEFPLGMLDFAVKVAAVGATEMFSLYVDGGLDANGYWKQNEGGTWVNLATAPYGGATTIDGDKIRFDFKITDGGAFDNDGKADGVITDPGAVGFMPLSLVGYQPDVVLQTGSGFFF
jgi:hypothetical protein